MVYATLVFASASNHLEFEGLPICGSKEKFSKELEKKGYKRVVNDDFICNNNSIFSKSTVRLMTFGTQNQVQSICVFLPESDSWDSLLYEYDKWKRYLTQQYGNPIENRAEFNTLSAPKTHENKMLALKSGECSYRTIFQSAGGMVILLLNYSDEFGYCPQLIYMDNGMSEDLLNQMTHLNFMGVPITGTIESFVAELEKKGLKYQMMYNDVAALKGDFAGYKDCNIYVQSVEGQEVVYSVGVTFPESSNWSQLNSNYNFIKSMLIEKYGSPSECIEVFQSRIQPNDDQMKWNYALAGRCDYNSQFELEEGSISLSIKHLNTAYNTYCYVQLLYMDGLNTFRSKSNAMNDL